MKARVPKYVVASVCLFSGWSAIALGSPGKEFWAVLAENTLDPIDLIVIAGNPDPARAANVTIANAAGLVASATIPPRSAQVFDLGMSCKVSETQLVRAAYRVTSDIPVNAYQYVGYPPDMASSGEESAALLLPGEALGSEYLILSWPGSPLQWEPSLVTVVARAPVQVTVQVSAPTRAGGSVPALPAGGSFTTSLDAFDVLQLGSMPSGDLTGTRVSATGPVEVFASCPYCHIGPRSGADTMIEVMMPVDWWGTTVVGAASEPMTSDINHWRVLAQKDGTQVTTDPVVPGKTPAVIDGGGFLEFQIAADFVLTASAPVLLARYNTVGEVAICGAGCPDPAMSLMLPAERFARSAVFSLPIIPAETLNWIDIVAGPGTSVTLDGIPVSAGSFIPVGSSGFSHAQVQLSNATESHTIDADQPIGAYAGNGEDNTGATFPLDMEPPANLPPTCDAGGPYATSCAATTTEVPLDGSRSSDPEGATLSYVWSSSSSAVSFDDPTRAKPVATVHGLGTFPVDLQVSDGRNTVSCSTPINLTGDPAVPPELDRQVTPLWLAKRLTSLDVLFSWQDLGGSPMSYNVYEGILGQWDGHVPLQCNVVGGVGSPTRREQAFTTGSGSRYYKMSAANCAQEGPTGGDPSRSTCDP